MMTGTKTEPGSTVGYSVSNPLCSPFVRLSLVPLAWLQIRAPLGSTGAPIHATYAEPDHTRLQAESVLEFQDVSFTVKIKDKVR